MYEDMGVSELLSVIDSKSTVEAQAMINDNLKNKKPPTDNGERYCWMLLVREGKCDRYSFSFEQVMEALAYAESKGYKNIHKYFNLQNLYFSNEDFSNIVFKDFNFTKVKLDSLKFKNVIFSPDVVFSNSKCFFLKFKDSTLDGVDFSHSKLNSVKFFNTSCVGVNFRYADLSSVKFTKVDFTNADISNAKIDWSVLEEDHKINGLRFFIPSRFVDAINNKKPIESVLYESLDLHAKYHEISYELKLVIIKDLIRAINESELSHDQKIKAFDVFRKDKFLISENGKSSFMLWLFNTNIYEPVFQKLFHDAKEALQKSLTPELPENEMSPLLPFGLV